MSWNVTVKGSAQKIQAHIEREFAELLKHDPHGEYASAKSALLAALKPVPPNEICSLESYGSFGNWLSDGQPKVSFEVKIDLRVMDLL